MREGTNVVGAVSAVVARFIDFGAQREIAAVVVGGGVAMQRHPGPAAVHGRLDRGGSVSSWRAAALPTLRCRAVINRARALGVICRNSRGRSDRHWICTATTAVAAVPAK